MSFFGSTDYFAEVARGEVPGEKIELMQGFNPQVDTSTAENLWDIGGILVYATANEQWELVSDDGDDTAAGTGAQEVTIDYLDDSYGIQQEVLATNGGTVSFVSTNMFRFIRMKVTAVGSGSQNAGLLTVQVSGGGSARGGITTGGNKSLHGFYTVEAGKTAYMTAAYATIAKNKDADISIFTTNGANGIFFKQVPVSIYQNSIVLSTRAPIGPFEEKTDVKFQCVTENNNTGIDATIQLWVIDN